MATTTPAGPPIGLLANGAAFVPPEYYNLPGFGYASLQAQMQDAMNAYQQGAGVFGGNNIPKYNGVAGSGPNGTFAGGFALQPANVGGSTAGYTAYGNQPFDPYKGRGNGNGGLLGPPGGGGAPPGGGGTPPGAGGPPGTTPPGGIVTTPPLPPSTGPTLPGTQVPPRTRGNEPPNYNTAPTPTGGLLSAGAPKVTTAPVNQHTTGYGDSYLPAPGSATELQARTLAAMQPYDANGKWLDLGGQMRTLSGQTGDAADLARRQMNNAYNAGGSRYGSTWSINYAAVSQTPEPYIAAGIAKANPDGTYEMLKLQDPESQQWIPIAEWQSKYGT